MNMAKRDEYSGYEPYKNYETYYTKYTPYPAAVEDEAAKVSTHEQSLTPEMATDHFR
jgi:hypothetical protein